MSAHASPCSSVHSKMGSSPEIRRLPLPACVFSSLVPLCSLWLLSPFICISCWPPGPAHRCPEQSLNVCTFLCSLTSHLCFSRLGDAVRHAGRHATGRPPAFRGLLLLLHGPQVSMAPLQPERSGWGGAERPPQEALGGYSRLSHAALMAPRRLAGSVLEPYHLGK